MICAVLSKYGVMWTSCRLKTCQTLLCLSPSLARSHTHLHRPQFTAFSTANLSQVLLHYSNFLPMPPPNCSILFSVPPQKIPAHPSRQRHLIRSIIKQNVTLYKWVLINKCPISNTLLTLSSEPPVETCKSNQLKLFHFITQKKNKMMAFRVSSAKRAINS